MKHEEKPMAERMERILNRIMGKLEQPIINKRELYAHCKKIKEKIKNEK